MFEVVADAEHRLVGAAFQDEVGAAGKEAVEGGAAVHGGAQVAAAQRGLAHHRERAGPADGGAEAEELVLGDAVQLPEEPGELGRGDPGQVVAEEQRRDLRAPQQRHGVHAAALGAAQHGPHMVHGDRPPGHVTTLAPVAPRQNTA